MKRRAFYLPLVALLLLFGACHKDNDGRVELLLEPFGSTTKLTLAGDTVATWDNGDMINFNGAEVSITREDNGHAYISDAYAQTTNSACFPASLKEGSLAGDNVTFTLPEVYHYRTSGGNQQLELPMVARTDNGKPLRFRHLTAALCFTIRNDRSETLVIDSLSVSSTAYQLSGELSVNMNDNLASLSPVSTGGSVSRVTIFFDRERLELAPGASRKVMIPVLPVGDGNQFTVTVAARYQGTRYNYTKTQSSGGALARNVLAYANMSLNNSPTETRRLFLGTGTSEAYPLQINNAADMIAFVEACNNEWRSDGNYYYAKYFSVNHNIDMTGISINPIVNFTNARFKGNNKTISNLTIIGTGENCGLFASVGGIRIENLTLRDVTVQSSVSIPMNKLYIGALCGNLNGTTIDNCHVDGMTVTVSNASGGVCLGGIAGHSTAAVSISNCTVNYSQTFSTSTSEMSFGNIIGYCEAGTAVTPTLTNCTATNTSLSLASSNGTLYAGGLVGYSKVVNLTLKTCLWSGALTVNSGSGALHAGGLVGMVFSGMLIPTSCTAGTSGSTISATATGSIKRLGAYIGSNNGTVLNFAGSGCSRNVTLTLNGASVSADIGS